MIEIIPAILPKSYLDLEDHLARVQGVTKAVQIDVVDGIFAPNTTWPYVGRDSFETILSEENGLPFWEDFDFEIDLMVQNSKDAALEWIRAGASKIIIHIESPDDRGALEAIQDVRTGEVPVEVILAISQETPVEKLETLAHLASGIQVMGIDHIGFQGEPFDVHTYEKLRTLKEKYPNHALSVDGAVTQDNAKALIDAGATRFVVGSAIWSGDAKDNYYTLKSIVDSH